MWLWCHIFILPLSVGCEGVSTLGLPCMGGRGLCQRTDGGGWVGRWQNTENALDPVASAGWEQPKSWCRVFLLYWNKHTLHQSSVKRICTHRIMLVENGRQTICWFVIRVLKSILKHTDSTCIYFGHCWIPTSWSWIAFQFNPTILFNHFIHNMTACLYVVGESPNWLSRWLDYQQWCSRTSATFRLPGQ